MIPSPIDPRLTGVGSGQKPIDNKTADRAKELKPPSPTQVKGQIREHGTKNIQEHTAYHSNSIKVAVQKLYEQLDNVQEEEGKKLSPEKKQELISDFNREYCEKHFTEADPNKKKSLYILRDSSVGTKTKGNITSKAYAISFRKAETEKILHSLIFKITTKNTDGTDSKTIYSLTDDPNLLNGPNARNYTSNSVEGIINKRLGKEYKNYSPSKQPSDEKAKEIASNYVDNYVARIDREEKK